ARWPRVRLPKARSSILLLRHDDPERLRRDAQAHPHEPLRRVEEIVVDAERAARPFEGGPPPHPCLDPRRGPAPLAVQPLRELVAALVAQEDDGEEAVVGPAGGAEWKVRPDLRHVQEFREKEIVRNDLAVDLDPPGTLLGDTDETLGRHLAELLLPLAIVVERIAHRDQGGEGAEPHPLDEDAIAPRSFGDADVEFAFRGRAAGLRDGFGRMQEAE